MFNYEFFYKKFFDWYTSFEINATNERAENFFKKMFDDSFTFCYDDVFEDDETVITKIFRGTYLTSAQSITGQLEKFEWIEVKLGVKDESSNIISSKTIGYEFFKI